MDGQKSSEHETRRLVKCCKEYTRNDIEWHKTFLRMAFDISLLSKDPSSQIGAIVVSPCRTKIASGFNGFPSKIPDYIEWWDNRDPKAALFTKYELVDHAERNAIDYSKYDLTGWTMYVTDQPCFNCTKAIYKAGIKTVYHSNKNQIKMDLQSEKSEAILKLGNMKMYFIDKEELHV